MNKLKLNANRILSKSYDAPVNQVESSSRNTGNSIDLKMHFLKSHNFTNPRKQEETDYGVQRFYRPPPVFKDENGRHKNSWGIDYTSPVS